MAKEEIKNTFKTRKNLIITGALVIVALAFISNMYYLGTRYGGISIEDFMDFHK